MKVRVLVVASLAAGGACLAGALTTACSDAMDERPATSLHGDASLTTQAEVDDSNMIPCAPRAVLQNVCQQCHSRPTKNAAPFPIQRLNDIQSVHLGEVTRLDMIDELNQDLMPLPPVTITPEEKKTLLDWLVAGAPAVLATSCSADAGLEAAASNRVFVDAGEALKR